MKNGSSEWIRTTDPQLRRLLLYPAELRTHLNLDSTICENKLKKKLNNYKILYGGSVNHKTIKSISSIDNINGFLIGGASQSSKKFIDIIKNSYK